MSEDTVVRFQKPGTVRDALTELLREGAQRLLKQAVEAELEEFLAPYAEQHDAQGHAAVVRNGYLPEREVLCQWASNFPHLWALNIPHPRLVN